MKKKLTPHPNPKERMDHILMNIRINKSMLERATIAANDEIDRVKQKYAIQIDDWNQNVSHLEKELEKIALKQSLVVFEGQDRAVFSHGCVMLKLEKRVKKIKGMLEKLKTEGIKEAVKVSKEVVDWDAVEKLDDDTLYRLGTERIEKQHVSYELAGV